MRSFVKAFLLTWPDIVELFCIRERGEGTILLLWLIQMATMLHQRQDSWTLRRARHLTVSLNLGCGRICTTNTLDDTISFITIKPLRCLTISILREEFCAQ